MKITDVLLTSCFNSTTFNSVKSEYDFAPAPGNLFICIKLCQMYTLAYLHNVHMRNPMSFTIFDYAIS